jgi:CBS domain-containing protein
MFEWRGALTWINAWRRQSLIMVTRLEGDTNMTLTAADIMTRKVVTAKPGDSVSVVAKLLGVHAISAVPVCGEDGRLAGIVSEGDLMLPFGKENAVRRAWWLDLLAEGTDLAPAFIDYIKVDRRRAQDLMVSPVITVTETASVPEIADLLARHRIKRVPVMRGDALVGIVSRADVVRALARMQLAEA